MKKILLLILPIIFITGCGKQEIITLEDKYYNNNTFITSTATEIDSYLENKESFILYTYNNYCTLKIPCESVFESFMANNNISILSIPFSELKNSKLSKKIKYAPTVIIVDKGKVITSLNAESDNDLPKYQDVDEFTNWIKEYIVIDRGI